MIINQTAHHPLYIRTRARPLSFTSVSHLCNRVILYDTSTLYPDLQASSFTKYIRSILFGSNHKQTGTNLYNFLFCILMHNISAVHVYYALLILYEIARKWNAHRRI